MAESGRPERGPDLIVLTGFLGSGKTTLLRDLLESREAAGTAILVNEVGAIGLDEALLRRAGGETVEAVPMAMLANGCVCCQIGGDLSAAIEAVLMADRPSDAPPLARIVLETSGLSRPGPILRQLAVLAPFRLRAFVVATFDAVRGLAVETFDEAAAQWAGAHRIVATKTDLVAPDDLDRTRRTIASINPLAEIVATRDRDDAVRTAFAPPAAGSAPLVLAASSAPPDASTGHSRLKPFLLRPTAPIAYDDLAAWLDNLAGVAGERLLRLKGVLALSDGPPVLVQSVGTMFAAPQAAPRVWGETGSFLVLIAREIEAAEIEAVGPAIGLMATERRAESVSRPRAVAL